MPTRVLRNEFVLDVPARVVFDHVRDPASYIGLSPLVIAVTDIESLDGGFRYRAVERVPIVGRWTYDNPLRVTLFGAGTGPFVVHGAVESNGGIHVDYRYDIDPDGDGCRVRDVVSLRTPFGLAGFSARRARAVQLGRPGVLAERLAVTG
jgi:hypothetical protein